MVKTEVKSHDPEIGGFIAMMTYFCYFILVVVSFNFGTMLDVPFEIIYLF